jgi:glucosylceramidase
MLKKCLSLKSQFAKRVSISLTAVSLVLLSIAAGVAAQNDTTFVIVSSKGNYWKEATFTEGSNATVTVNEGQTHQTWRGLCGTFNEAGWDALKVLSQDKQDEAIKLLFDRENGIGFQWGRIPIGASDYALDRYSLDDAQDDFNMDHFSIERDKGCLIQYIKAAQAVKDDIKFWASPWTPPPWMKENAFDAAGYDGGSMRNNSQVFDALALYFSKFIEAYTAAGIPINAVCPQNEPGYTRNYPTCAWGKYNYENKTNNTTGNVDDPEYLSTFVASHLYPKLHQDHPETEIWFGTLSNATSAPGYWNGMKGKDNSGIIKGLGLQWNNLNMVSSNANNYFVFCSEHQCGNYYWKPEVSSVEQADSVHFLKDMAPNNHFYGVETWDLMKRWFEAGTHLYSAWNMVLDTKGFNLNTGVKWPQNALLVVDRNAKTLTATPYYYVMRHIGQYVDSGAVRLSTTGGNALAFKNPNGAIVTIVSNTGGSTPITVSADGKNIQFTHPGQGWATVYTGPPPVLPVSAKKSINQLSGNRCGLTITSKGNQYRIALPSQQAGHIELLTPAGRLLASLAIPQGSKEVMIPKLASHTGLLIVRAVTGVEVKTAQLVAY